MKKFLKIAVTVIAVLLVVVLTAPIFLRGKIAELVRTEANAVLVPRLDFERLGISLLRHFPNASLELKGVTLVGVAPFEGDTIASVGRLSVVVDPWSLLGDGGLEVRKLLIAKPDLRARKLADGSVNWLLMKPSEEEPEAEAAAEEESTDTGSAFSLSVRDFRITDAALSYVDDSTHTSFRTLLPLLRLRGDFSAAQSTLDLRMRTEETTFSSGVVTLLSNAEIELNADVAADLEKNRFELKENKLRLNAIEATLDGWAELGDDAVAMDLSLGCERVEFKDVLSLIPAFYTRNYRGLSASGELTLSLWAKGELRGAELPAFGLELGVRNGGFQYASLPKAVSDINIQASVTNPGGVMDRTVVDIPTFGLRMGDNSLAATFHGTTLVSDPDLRASLEGKLDLADIGEVYPLEDGMSLKGFIQADLSAAGRMSDVENRRYDRVSASGNFVVENVDAQLPGLPAIGLRRAAAGISPQAMTLGELSLTIGGSDLAANGQLTDYIDYLLRGATLSGRLYVNSKLLDLNEILASLSSTETAEGDAAEESAAEEAPAGGDAAAQAVEIPRNLNLSLRTEVGKLLYEKMVIEQLSGEVRVANGTLSLDGLRMKAFDGSLTASGSYSTADAAHPALAFNLGFTDASYARTFEQLEMVQRIVPLFEKAGGVYSMSLDMKMNLDQAMEPDLMSLDAHGELRSADIHIEQLKAFEVLAKTLGNDALSSIRAKDVVIPFSIRQGRLTTKPFDLKMGDVSLNLSGSTGLDQSIDYTAQVALPASATGGVLSKVNVGIGGTFTDPKITIGVKEAVEEAARNLIDEQVQKLTGNESLSEAVQEQAAKLREEARKAGEKLIAAAEEQRTKLVDAAKNPIAKLAAEKAGDKLVDEARKQADKLTAEAEAQIEKLASKAQ